MQVLVDAVETWLVRLAVVLGAIAILLPLLNVWRSRNIRRGRAAGSSARLLRWPVVFALAAAYVAAGILLWKPLPIRFGATARLVLVLAGALLYFPGVMLYLWGYRTLGRLFGVSSSAAAELYQQHRLIDSGPYAIVRHPMYLGVLLAAFGALLLFRTWAMVIFTPMSLVVIARARREEKLLADEFGEQWDSYAKRVPGWVPKPWVRSKDSRSSGS
jgi:protein-S-isoprenylcysteine O-methyltransferase Ste14